MQVEELLPCLRENQDTLIREIRIGKYKPNPVRRVEIPKETKGEFRKLGVPTVVPYKGLKYHYYYCPTTKKRGCLNAPMIKEDDLSECILESIKAHIAGVASMESILAGTDGQRAATALAKQYSAQIADNQRQLEQIRGFNSSLYENMIRGIITNKECKSLKSKYTADEVRLRSAIADLTGQLDDVLAGKGERLKWMEHFRQFEDLTELDRRTVTNLIQSIKVVSKTELQITFSYHNEYESALSLLKKGVA
ncbi:MAG: hypothetical protein LBQ71_06670 [Hungatella sp.]|nr:hypothetical protein [Hungatella sp.]